MGSDSSTSSGNHHQPTLKIIMKFAITILLMTLLVAPQSTNAKPQPSEPDWLYEPDGSCGCSDLAIKTNRGTYGKCNLAHAGSGRVFCYLNTYDLNDVCCQASNSNTCMNYDLCDSTTAKGGF